MPRERFPLAFWCLTLAARAAGAAKEILLAMALGASPWKDALVVAYTAPALLASYCNETLPPLLTPRWARGAPPSRSAGLVAAVVAVLLAFTLAALCRPRWLIAAIAPGLPPPVAALAVELERWLALNLALLGGQSLLSARLNAQRRFAGTPSATALAALTVIATLACTRAWPLPRRIVAIAAALTAGNALALATLLAVAWRARSRSPRSAPLPPTRLAPSSSHRSLAALLLAMLVVNLIPLAERIAASGLRPGSLAAYDYGERLVQLVFSLSVAPVTAVAFTRLAELASAEAAVFALHLETGLGALLTLVMPLAAGLAVFSKLLTRCVFGWGRFGAAALAATSPVVAIKGAGLALDAAVYYLLFALYARGHATAKLPLALVLAGANVPFAFYGAAHGGLAGLAAAHVAGYGCGLGWLALRRRHYLPHLRWRPLARTAAQAALVSAAAASAARALLPPSALAGALGGAASAAWALAAAALTAVAAYVLARCFAPALVPGLHRALHPAPRLPAPAAALVPAEVA